MKYLTRHLIGIAALGAIALILPACAGHKELKAPCSAALNSGSFWSGSAYASEGCGPLLDINVATPPAAAIVEN
ncbi:hypothetical protein [Phyllobacterium sp. P30BS-XVII]|uniref:hypothetical protein n=1 Tax=Phyllobacterium sp. P30BS-XVII TaxID=2587046 RepID=UPI0015FDC3F7|nr:hypothetical protein [Phyllobacterium sp. P30BS-XVII]MBA8904146.1 hypothetical protein [Phyllobacterium sp. P30BS-XVII]